jgi:SAM-dependent methyltransferase
MLWLLSIDGGLFLAPISDPRHVLDIATGTGIWAMVSLITSPNSSDPYEHNQTNSANTRQEFAERHPNSRVVGTDLSPIQPTYVPVNCNFEIADAEDVWSFHTRFDYIHGRALLSCFTDPRSIIQKAFDNLQPGGYFELQDGLFPFQFLGTQPPASHPLQIFLSSTLEASRKTGRSWDNVQHYKKWMEEVGFEDVVEKRFQWPCGPWAKGEKMKKLGVYFLEDLKHVIEPICMKLFVKVLGWSETRVKSFLEELVPCLGARRVYLYETV